MGGCGCGGESENWKRFDDGRVEASSGYRGGGGRVGEEDNSSGGATTATEMEAARAEEIPTRVEVERDHENDDEEDYDYGGKHDSTVYGEGDRFRIGSGWALLIRVSKTHDFRFRVNLGMKKSRQRESCLKEVKEGFGVLAMATKR